MRRNRPAVLGRPGFACGLGSSNHLHPGSAAGHALPLIEDRPRSSVSGVERAFLRNFRQEGRLLIQVSDKPS